MNFTLKIFTIDVYHCHQANLLTRVYADCRSGWFNCVVASIFGRLILKTLLPILNICLCSVAKRMYGMSAWASLMLIFRKWWDTTETVLWLYYLLHKIDWQLLLSVLHTIGYLLIACCPCFVYSAYETHGRQSALQIKYITGNSSSALVCKAA